MLYLFFYFFSLFFTVMATAGFIAFIINQDKRIYKWSYRILLAGFIIHTLFLLRQFLELGAAPVLTLKSALGFFAWTTIGAYLVFHLKFKLRILGSFIAPLAAVLMIISFSIPGQEVFHVQPTFRNFWLILHIRTIFIGNGIFFYHLHFRDYVSDTGISNQEEKDRINL